MFDRTGQIAPGWPAVPAAFGVPGRHVERCAGNAAGDAEIALGRVRRTGSAPGCPSPGTSRRPGDRHERVPQPAAGAGAGRRRGCSAGGLGIRPDDAAREIDRAGARRRGPVRAVRGHFGVLVRCRAGSPRGLRGCRPASTGWFRPAAATAAAVPRRRLGTPRPRRWTRARASGALLRGGRRRSGSRSRARRRAKRRRRPRCAALDRPLNRDSARGREAVAESPLQPATGSTRVPRTPCRATVSRSSRGSDRWVDAPPRGFRGRYESRRSRRCGSLPVARVCRSFTSMAGRRSGHRRC